MFCPLGWLMRKVNRGQKAGSISLPAPVGGLNTRDALASMEPIYCSDMANWFPNGTSVDVRKGVASQTTQTGLNSSSASAGFVKYGETSLWAAIYKQSTSELILKDVVGGTTQTIAGHTVLYAPSYAQFTNSAGTFVAAVFRNVSAANNYYTFDGTTWTARTAATTNAQNFSQVLSFRNRLWFFADIAGKGLSVYYLPTSAITGTTIEFPLGGVASKGGILYSMGTWTRDAGEGGSDDLLVFTTTAGQAIVYQGTDPSSPSTFALVGVFDVSRPIAKPLKYGSDLLLPCEDGLYSMNQILGGNVGPEFAISNIIRQRWQEFATISLGVAAGSLLERVSVVYSAKLSHLMASFRVSGSSGAVSSQALVMNTVTKAWTEYTGSAMYGYNVDTLAGDIYFGNITGGNTATVYKFGTATTDNGAAIGASCTPAFNYLGREGIKQITAVRPTVTAGGTSTLIMQAAPDFQPFNTTNSDTATVAAGSFAPLLSLPAVGTALSIGASLSTSSSFKWYSTDVLFVPGGFV